MRISDWSSDVCSADLQPDTEPQEIPSGRHPLQRLQMLLQGVHVAQMWQQALCQLQLLGCERWAVFIAIDDEHGRLPGNYGCQAKRHPPVAIAGTRMQSDERTGGKEGVLTGTSRWA